MDEQVERPGDGKRRESGKAPRDMAARAGKAAKWAFVIALATVAGVIGFLQIFRAHPAQKALGDFFVRLQEGDLEGCLELVDPEGQIGSLWESDAHAVREAVSSFLGRYRLEFSGLSFATRSEKDAAEVSLKGGRVSVYEREAEGPPAFAFDMRGTDLVFYLEKKSGKWLLEGINYDLEELLAEGRELLPL